MEMYPHWNARDNYRFGLKKKKRKRDKADDPGASMKKCRARYGLDMQEQWCRPCRRKKKCIRVQRLMEGTGNGSSGSSGQAMPMNMAAMAAARPGMPPNAANPAAMRPNFKYTSGVRNVAGAPVMPAQPVQSPMPPQQPQQQQPPQAAVFIQGQEPLTASMLAQAPPSEQKQMLGERLFPLIQSMFPDLAGKITGMLLEIDNSELVHMLEHKESLTSKVEEAVAVLSAHKTTPE